MFERAALVKELYVVRERQGGKKTLPLRGNRASHRSILAGAGGKGQGRSRAGDAPWHHFKAREVVRPSAQAPPRGFRACPAFAAAAVAVACWAAGLCSAGGGIDPGRPAQPSRCPAGEGRPGPQRAGRAAGSASASAGAAAARRAAPSHCRPRGRCAASGPAGASRRWWRPGRAGCGCRARWRRRSRGTAWTRCPPRRTCCCCGRRRWKLGPPRPGRPSSWRGSPFGGGSCGRRRRRRQSCRWCPAATWPPGRPSSPRSPPPSRRAGCCWAWSTRCCWPPAGRSSRGAAAGTGSWGTATWRAGGSRARWRRCRAWPWRRRRRAAGTRRPSAMRATCICGAGTRPDSSGCPPKCPPRVEQQRQPAGRPLRPRRIAPSASVATGWTWGLRTGPDATRCPSSRCSPSPPCWTCPRRPRCGGSAAGPDTRPP